MKIGYGVGQPSPVLPNYEFPTEFVGLPGSNVIIGGSVLYDFLGEVSELDLISGDDLCNDIGLTAGNPHNSDAGWLKYIKDERILYVAKKTFRYATSWDDIDSVGAIFGTIKITIEGNVYAVRLLTVSEWNILIQAVHKDGIDP